MDQIGFYRMKDVLKIIPMSKATWITGVNSGTYPKSVRIGRNMVAWKKSDIHALIKKIEKGEMVYAE